MRRLCLATFIIMIAWAATAWADAPKNVIEVYAPNYDTLTALADYNVRFEDFEREDWVRIICDAKTIDELRAAGFEVNVLIADLDNWVKSRAQAMAQRPKEAPPTDVVLDHYLTHAEMTTFLYDLEAAYPDILSVEEIGDSVGGRALFVAKISDNVADNEAEPAVFFEHNIHGDEIAGYTLALFVIQWLVTEYGSDPDVTALVDNREIFIEPLTNPDGNYDDPTWGRSRYNNHGVDLNRNYGYMWDPDESAPGDAPHSEPETQAVAEFWEGNQPFIFGMSGHSGTVIFLHSWGYIGNDPADDAEFDYIGEQYIYPNHCTDPEMNVQGSCYNVLYQAVGVTMDEMYGSHGMLGLSYELSYTKECSWATSVAVWEDHQPAIKWLLQEVGNGLHGTVTDIDSGDPVGALVQVDGKWMTFTDYEVGDFHKYLRAGSYTLHVTANNYEDYTTTFAITNGAPTNLNIELTPSAEPHTFLFRWLYDEMPNSYSSTYPPANAFGPPDGDFISLGNGGFAVVDLGPDGIADDAGSDLVVYEAGSDGDEPFTLYGSSGGPHGPWVELGEGDGTSGFDLDAAGLASVRYLKIEDGGSDLDAANDGFDLDAIGTPVYLAAFSADVTEGARPLEVHFTDHSTGSPTSWSWDFGDGNTSTEQNPTNTYTDLGTYDVTLIINGPEGEKTLTKTAYISVIELPPTVDFTGTPTSGVTPLDVQFTSAITGVVETYAWTFGDGGTSDEANPLHTYEAPGVYTVKVEVTGPGGSVSRQRWRYIKVNCGAPIADFEADVLTGQAPLTVHFTNLSEVSADCPAAYLWDYGDGQTGTAAEPQHVYETAGVYTVTLTATNDGGTDVESKTGYITVEGGADDDDDNTPDDDDNDASPADDDNDDVDDDDDAAGDGDDDDDSGCGC
ncbi:MAG: PKD domain-containing protein [Myxococcales bacterium]|nr:PKD domain-containing protein [Myxococcales bacterium]